MKEKHPNRRRWFEKRSSGLCIPSSWHGWAATVAYFVMAVFIVTVGIQKDQFSLWDTQLFFVWLPLVGLSSLYLVAVYRYGWLPGKGNNKSET